MNFLIYLIFWILSNIYFKNALLHFAQCLFILLILLLWRLFCFHFYAILTFHYLYFIAFSIFTFIDSSTHLLICILTYLCFSVAVCLHAVNILKVLRGCNVFNLSFSVHFFWGQGLSLILVLSFSWVGWKSARHSSFPVSALLTSILMYDCWNLNLNLNSYPFNK